MVMERIRSRENLKAADSLQMKTNLNMTCGKERICKRMNRAFSMMLKKMLSDRYPNLSLFFSYYPAYYDP